MKPHLPAPPAPPMPGLNEITELWTVSGLHGMVFAIKADAEKAAKDEFPNESPYRNYARVHSLTLWGTAVGKLDLVRKLNRF